MKKRVSELKIDKNFIFVIEQKEIWPLFKKADLMVRPTFMDAYGVSIEEALYFGCPAVASNVCKRPKGTIIFKNRDFKDFFEKCKKILPKNR
jgi:glycosyltransferase involved in cell wall biosynthesis